MKITTTLLLAGVTAKQLSRKEFAEDKQEYQLANVASTELADPDGAEPPAEGEAAPASKGSNKKKS